MFKDAIFILFQYIAPQHAISRLAGYIANCKFPLIKNSAITFFIKKYGVDLSEAIESDASGYETFNLFFTRALKSDARPICVDVLDIACPADGAISEIGVIKNDRLLQAKNHYYSLINLLGGDETLVNSFEDGTFATVYLSPKDYHRVHMPVTGILRKMIFVPGKLFSVNQTTANNVPNLFARNERVICIFDTDYGAMAVILVGAMIVASIETVWAGVIAPYQLGVHTTHYSASDLPRITLQKGDELGRFLLGSTAILLFQKNAASWASALEQGTFVKMGQPIGKLNASLS
jgi:phosphatidylserine decarboxylase